MMTFYRMRLVFIYSLFFVYAYTLRVMFFIEPDVSISALINSDCGVYITVNLSLDMSLESTINDLSILLHCTDVFPLLNKYSVLAPILLHTTSILSIGNTISVIALVDLITSLSNMLSNIWYATLLLLNSIKLIKYSSKLGPNFNTSVLTTCVF